MRQAIGTRRTCFPSIDRPYVQLFRDDNQRTPCHSIVKQALTVSNNKLALPGLSLSETPPNRYN